MPSDEDIDWFSKEIDNAEDDKFQREVLKDSVVPSILAVAFLNILILFISPTE